MFVYPLYARCPSEFDRFWYLFMCAAGELRVRSVYLCVLVVGIVLITKWKRAKILFIATLRCVEHHPHIWACKFRYAERVWAGGLYYEVCWTQNKMVKVLFWNLYSKQPFLKQFIQTLNVSLKIKNAYFHIFTKHLFVVFKMMFSKYMF